MLFLVPYAFSSCAPSHESRRETGTRLNLILISVDSLRADHLGCYGYFRDTTPYIDRLAERGVLFQNAISSTSWTIPAHMALFTSQFDAVHGVVSDRFCLDGKRITLAKILKEEGYSTAGFHSSPYLESRYGFSSGFDLYVRCDYHEALRKYEKEAGFAETASLMELIEKNPREIPQEIVQHLESPHRTVTGPTATALGLKWIREHKEGPFFLFLHYWDVHYDYIPPPPFDTRFGEKSSLDVGNLKKNPRINKNMPEEDLAYLISQYDGEIAFTDKNIQNLLKGLEDMGLRDRTCICLTADHGEEFFEHGHKGHGATLFDEVLRVPLVFSLPGHILQGIRPKEQVGLVDVAPTLLELLSVESHPEMMGRSLLPLLKGEGRWEEKPLLSELYQSDGSLNFSSLRTPLWKLIRFKKEYRFFDLMKDPKETIPLVRIPGGKVYINLLEEILAKYRKRAESLPKDGTSRVVFDRLMEQQLKALGYMNE